jgi:predicted nuclease of predicted toxin-antitoxin system
VIVWIDAQLSPDLATWLVDAFGVEAYPVRDLGLRNAKDAEIFRAARVVGAVVMTKDSDFVELVSRLGTPPQVLWITCGNTSNSRPKAILEYALSTAFRLLDRGEPLVEISDVT